MVTVDLKQRLKPLYTAAAAPQIITMPPRHYLMIDGRGDPNSAPAYKAAVGALYTLAYGLRAAIKTSSGVVYKVMPLEGLWWVPEEDAFSYGDKSNWAWTMMISLPDEASGGMLEMIQPAAARKKPDLPLGRVRIETLHEGTAAQILHSGPFATEPATIAKLEAFIIAGGYTYAGKHHEIYLTDAQRSAPEKYRTIIRYPVRNA